MKRIDARRRPSKGRGLAVRSEALYLAHGSRCKRSNASDLWEDCGQAQPFTAGRHFFNIGETHDVAFAAAMFGSVHKIPRDFDGWESLARNVEKNFVRGWVANDGSKMFLWDDFGEVLLNANHGCVPISVEK